MREVTTTEPRTLYPPKSGITYWQVEHASTIVDGQSPHWIWIYVSQIYKFYHLYLSLPFALSEFSLGIFNANQICVSRSGSPIKLEQAVRFRQMTTQCYLLLDDSFQASLTDNGSDPKTVFRIHSLSQVGGDFSLVLIGHGCVHSCWFLVLCVWRLCWELTTMQRVYPWKPDYCFI